MKLPVVSGSAAVKAFGKAGYELDEQHGSHIVLRRSDPPHRRLTVPNLKELAKGTLRALIREAGLTVEEFSALVQLAHRGTAWASRYTITGRSGCTLTVSLPLRTETVAAWDRSANRVLATTAFGSQPAGTGALNVFAACE